MVSSSKKGGLGLLSALCTTIFFSLGRFGNAADPSSSCGTSGGHATVVIIGAGAAGLQWGILLEKAGIDYVILERAAEAGAFFSRFPRRRKLISVNKRHVGEGMSAEFALRHDWHSLLETDKLFGKFSRDFYPHADALVNYQRSIAADLNIVYGAAVNGTVWDGGASQHTISTSRGIWTGDHLVVATGYRVRDPPECLVRPGVPYQVRTYGDFPHPYDAATGEDDPFCKNKHIAVLGTGNAAFETVDMLSGCAASMHLIFKNKPRFSWQTHYVGDVRMHNGGLLDHYQLKSLDAIHSPINEQAWRGPNGDEEGCRDVLASTRQFGITRVVYAGGFTTQRDGLVNVTGSSKFPRVGAWWSDPDPNQPNRWFAGSLMHALDFRESAGGFIHGFRYLVRAQFHHVRAAHFGQPFPSTEFPSFEDAALHATARIQSSSGLYQMSDFLVDLIVIRGDGSAVYYQEIPKPWVSQFTRGARGAISIKMMFSDKNAWTWELQWDDDRALRQEGLFVHPVVTPLKLGDGGEEAREDQPIHIPEDILATWKSSFLIKKIRKALVGSLSQTLLLNAVMYVAHQRSEREKESERERDNQE